MVSQLTVLMVTDHSNCVSGSRTSRTPGTGNIKGVVRPSRASTYQSLLGTEYVGVVGRFSDGLSRLLYLPMVRV